MNKVINSIQHHISSMMKVSAKYGKEAGALGKLHSASAEGATFSNKAAKMIADNPKYSEDMIKRLLNKGIVEGMPEDKIKRMHELANRIRNDLGSGMRSSDLGQEIHNAGFNAPYRKSLQNLGFL